jgi:RNA polymerase sigma-70 factor (ECF subfamily)
MTVRREWDKPHSQDLLRRVLEERHTSIRRFVRYLGRGILPAEDIAQEVHLRALKSEKIPATEPEIMAWIFRIARNLVIDETRRRKRRDDKEISISHGTGDHDEVVPLPVKESARRQVSQKEMENILSQALGELGEDTLELVTLRFFGGMSTTQIAESCSLPVGTVCAKIFRATKKMRGYLEERGYSFSELDPGE